MFICILFNFYLISIFLSFYHGHAQVQPQLADLLESLNRVPDLPGDFEGKVKLREWLSLLHRMRAADELEPPQVRQLLFDLESAYNAFHRFLAK